MLPTPETPDLPPTVYPPSEDSYLLLDTLSSPAEILFLSSRFALPSPSPLILEVGTGSGVVLALLTAHAPHIFGRADSLALAVDLNPDACRAARRTVSLASSTISTTVPQSQPSTGTFLDAAQSDLTSALRGGVVDVLVFNPPYVVTPEVPVRPGGDEGSGDGGEDGMRAFERESRYLDIAVAGGADGMQVTSRLLGELDRVLSARGVAYVLLSVRNRPAEVMQGLRAQGWCVGQVGASGRKGGIESLVIVRIAR